VRLEAQIGRGTGTFQQPCEAGGRERGATVDRLIKQYSAT
jgi:hypothetical protein